jgi:Type I restriction-modification system methyltransferase subunit
MTFTTEQFNQILGIDDSYKAPDALMKVMLDKEKREQLFREFLKLERDTSYDWFQSYYEAEQAQRKDKKQDFTPMSVATLLSKLTGEDEPHIFTDTTAGNGGVLIKAWRHNADPFSNPSEYWFVAQELSDRSIPFLIFNFAIRGWNGLIYHGDSLEGKYKNIYFIQNTENNWLGFSDVNVVLRNNFDNDDKEWLGINEFYGEQAIEHIESKFPDWIPLIEEKKGQMSLFE